MTKILEVNKMTPAKKFREMIKSKIKINKDEKTSLDGGFNAIIDLTTLDILLDVLIDNERDAIKEAFYCGRYEYNNYNSSSDEFYKTEYE